MIERVDFLLPLSSQYGVLHYFTEKIYEAALRRQLKCRLLPQEDYFTVPIKDPPDLTFAINGIPSDPEGVFLCDKIHVPHLSYIVDPPFRFFELLRSPYMIIACDDRFNCEVLRFNGFQRTLFLPYGVEPELFPPQGDDRAFDVVMIASYIDYQSNRISWKKKYPPPVVKAMEEAVERTINEISLSFIAAFMEALNRGVVSGEMENIDVDVVRALIDLELYLKGWDRVQLVKAVKDADLHVIGGKNSGWEEELKGRGNVHLHPMVPYEETIEIMKNSKIVLNSSIKNKEGASERIFSSLAVGAVPLTTETAYLKDYFVDEETLLFCRPNRYDLVNDKVNAFLADDGWRQAVAASGRTLVMEEHTWDRRLDSLFEVLNA